MRHEEAGLDLLRKPVELNVNVLRSAAVGRSFLIGDLDGGAVVFIDDHALLRARKLGENLIQEYHLLCRVHKACELGFTGAERDKSLAFAAPADRASVIEDDIALLAAASLKAAGEACVTRAVKDMLLGRTLGQSVSNAEILSLKKITEDAIGHLDEILSGSNQVLRQSGESVANVPSNCGAAIEQGANEGLKMLALLSGRLMLFDFGGVDDVAGRERRGMR